MHQVYSRDTARGGEAHCREEQIHTPQRQQLQASSAAGAAHRSLWQHQCGPAEETGQRSAEVLRDVQHTLPRRRQPLLHRVPAAPSRHLQTCKYVVLQAICFAKLLTFPLGTFLDPRYKDVADANEKFPELLLEVRVMMQIINDAT